MVTAKDIRRLYPNALKYQQHGSKQLFTLTYSEHSLIVSYETIIGFKTRNGYVFSDLFHSRTTTRHRNYLINQVAGTAKIVPHDEFTRRLKGVQDANIS
jgi:hypothetical protein